MWTLPSTSGRLGIASRADLTAQQAKVAIAIAIVIAIVITSRLEAQHLDAPFHCRPFPLPPRVSSHWRPAPRTTAPNRPRDRFFSAAMGFTTGFVRATLLDDVPC
jgi:hypothetical protein